MQETTGFQGFQRACEDKPKPSLRQPHYYMANITPYEVSLVQAIESGMYVWLPIYLKILSLGITKPSPLFPPLIGHRDVGNTE